ncbi:MAG TPA: prenyltransferase/squalene oxidase repeat-containing protein [Dehalococcoidia bacterium]|nr:prenyltransferase/squalene oxidase repeat-containing protein [Dehalococcoidia bacterium]
MPRKIIALLVAVVCLAGGGLSAQAATPQTDAAQQAIDYIRTLQNADGGFPAFGSESNAGTTIDAVLAFVSAGIHSNSVKNSGNSALDYLEAQATSYTTTADHAAKLVIGLVAAGEDPRDFAGEDWVAKMQSYYDGATHRYGQQTFEQMLYILARKSLGLSAGSGAVTYLESKELAQGCWEYADGWGCDTNSTAVAVQALVAAGVDSSDASIEAALDYLKSAQNADGGFPYLIPSDSDAQSTAWVLQALLAAGEDVDGGGPWEKAGGHTPMQALLSYQNAATGAFTYAGEDNAYATYQVVPALLSQPLLLPPSEEEATKTPRPTDTPAATATATVEATPTAAPAATVAPPATPLSQVLSVSTGPAAVPRVLASAGDGGSASGVSPAVSLLLVAGGCLAAGLLVRRLRGHQG